MQGIHYEGITSTCGQKIIKLSNYYKPSYYYKPSMFSETNIKTKINKLKSIKDNWDKVFF